MNYLKLSIEIGYVVVFLFAWRNLYVYEKDEHLRKLDTDVKYKRRVEAKKDGPSYFIMFLAAAVWPASLLVAGLVEGIPWLWKHSIGRETPYEKQQRLAKEAEEIEKLTKEFNLGLLELPAEPTKPTKPWETEFDRKMKGLTFSDFVENIGSRYPKLSRRDVLARAALEFGKYQDNEEEE